MDPVTHALSGATIIQAMPKAVRPAWMILWGALLAISPDLDIFFLKTPLDYITYHRGFTHSLLGAVALAMLGSLFFLGITNFKRVGHAPYLGGSGGWQFTGATVLGFIILLHHLWLDCVNSYGTQIFLPFSDYRVRLSGLFIVDPLLIIPLAVGLLWKRNNPRILVMILLWTVLYPAGAVLTRIGIEAHMRDTLPRTMLERPVENAYLTPDAFSPIHWKVLFKTPNDWLLSGYTIGQSTHPLDPSAYRVYPRPPQHIWQTAIAEDIMFREYAKFAQFPSLEELQTGPDGSTEYVFTDLRFGSTLAWVNELQNSLQKSEEKIFRIMARFNADGKLVAVRFVTGPGAGGDSGWVAPKL